MNRREFTTAGIVGLFLAPLCAAAGWIKGMFGAEELGSEYAAIFCGRNGMFGLRGDGSVEPEPLSGNLDRKPLVRPNGQCSVCGFVGGTHSRYCDQVILLPSKGEADAILDEAEAQRRIDAFFTRNNAWGKVPDRPMGIEHWMKGGQPRVPTPTPEWMRDLHDTMNRIHAKHRSK